MAADPEAPPAPRAVFSRRVSSSRRSLASQSEAFSFAGESREGGVVHRFFFLDSVGSDPQQVSGGRGAFLLMD